MRMISVSPAQFDILGGVLTHAASIESDLTTITRRVSRTATLDGGVVIDDRGYTDSDKTLEIVIANIKLVDHQAFTRMLKAYTQLVVSASEGCFLCAPSVYTTQQSNGFLTLLVIARLSS